MRLYGSLVVGFFFSVRLFILGFYIFKFFSRSLLLARVRLKFICFEGERLRGMYGIVLRILSTSFGKTSKISIVFIYSAVSVIYDENFTAALKTVQ